MVAQPFEGKIQRSSVKSRHFKTGAAFVEYNIRHSFDWLAVVLLPGGYQTGRRMLLIPRGLADNKAQRNSLTTASADQRYWRIDQVPILFPSYEWNFGLIERPG